MFTCTQPTTWPLSVVVADRVPSKSLAAMNALEAVADGTLHLSGRLGALPRSLWLIGLINW
jgi:hypothetical protein